MKNRYYQLSSSKEWYELLAQKLPSVIQENQITLDPKMGDGQLTYLKAQECLCPKQMDLKWNKDLELHRIPHPENELVLIDFCLSYLPLLHKGSSASQIADRR